jgi:diguanylate cyclase (GGDEF)-like protein
LKLRYRSALVVLVLAVVLAFGLIAGSRALIRAYTIAGATQYAQTTAEMVRTALTEAMLNGATASLPRLKMRLAESSGLNGIDVVRSTAVTEQFGTGVAGTVPLDPVSARVMQTGRAEYILADAGSRPVFRAAIPYIADSRGEPNCLSCHQVAEGTVLGVVNIELSLSELLAQLSAATWTLAAAVVLFVLLLLWVLNRTYRPIVDAAEGVDAAVQRAADGDLSARVPEKGSDEAGRIAAGLNRLLALLEDGLSQISNQIAKLVQFERRGGTPLLSETMHAVDQLVDGARFKQAIEEDETTAEVYARLSRVMQETFGLQRFSIYEVDAKARGLVPTVVDGEQGVDNRWCDQQITVRAEACRVRRTGHTVNGFQQTGLCAMFDGKRHQADLEHVCLPVLQSGGVGSVVQVVAPASEAERIAAQLPYLSIHLREAAPVLEAKRLMDTLRDSTMRDAMTGLYNRRFLEEYLENLTARVARDRLHLGVLMLDLDYFKKVNDTYGHEVGDKVLVELARVIRQTVRASDLTVRFGGEEFLVLLNATDAEGAMVLAEKVRAAVEAMRVAISGGTLQKTISIGVADFPGDGENFWQVLKYADVALYAAKDAGRNQVKRFVPEMWTGAAGEY